ncbi:MAG: protein kinase domain-containing protein [Persicimonas sp.]
MRETPAWATLGSVAVREFIGRGAMGLVFAGRDLERDTEVAVKMVALSSETDETLRQRFRHEVEASAALEHPGIVTVHDVGFLQEAMSGPDFETIPAGTPYLVMERIDRGTLREHVGRVSWPELEAILLDLLDALAHAHAAQIVHRDLKPANILLHRCGDGLAPKLADFGLAHALTGHNANRECVGTPRYMAPEQIDGAWRTHGPWSDLYAVGCIAFELACGRPLFEGMGVEVAYKKLNGARLPALDRLVETPPGFKVWLGRMLAPEARARFRHAAQAASALASIEMCGAQGAAHAPRFARVTPVLEPLLDEESDRAPGCAPSSGAHQAGRLPTRWPGLGVPSPGAPAQAIGFGLVGLRHKALTGRRAELARIWRRFRAVIEANRPQLFLVRGSRGCGKSRLLEAFARRIGELDAAHLVQTRHGPEEGFRRELAATLSNHFRLQGADPSEATAIIREAIRKEGGWCDGDAVLLARLARPDLRPSRTSRHYFGTVRRRRRYLVMSRFMRRLTRSKPVLALLDDAHWGADALGFCRYLLSFARERVGPVFVVASLSEEILGDRPVERSLVEQLCEYEAVAQHHLAPVCDSEQR